MSSGLFAGRYSLERVLGQGATATVHLARDTQGGTAVAIKIMRPELAQSRATDRFLKEIRRTATLDHPHILKVLDSGEVDGRPYFVLPYMEGGTLRMKLQRESQLPFDETIAILRTVADALDYAHAQGLIHRDVKPENILFTGGKACLGDFGIARVLETVYGTDGSTSSDTIRGTYAYMSPEQAAGNKNLDGRSDIYSLACVTYEMIAGMPAFIGPTPEAVVSQRFVHAPRELRVYRQSATPAIDLALAKAFAMSSADRYRTASEFVNALADAVQQRTQTSDGIPRPGRQPRWTRGSVIAVTAVAAIVLAAAIAALGTPGGRGFTGNSATLDTTRLVVLPLERDDSTNLPPWRDDDMLQQGLARYRDISVVDQYQVADAIRRHGPIETSNDAVVVAASLGAGRYIRGRVTRFGDRWNVSASLFEAPSGRALHQGRESVPQDIGSAAAAYARLADTLLLRGALVDTNPLHVAGARSLPAVQAFGRAQGALGEWDLARADSALQAAVSFDANYARAHLWLAQVRAWRDQSPNAWGTAAERALAISDQLNDREIRLASALAHLARASHDSACAVYESLAQRNDRDFAAWFGLGQCRMLNKRVVRDTSSPSGWRYQASAHQAMRAYGKAFEILPLVYRGYERGAFQQLQRLLLITSNMPIGYGPDSAVFWSRPGWMGDTLVMVPYTAEDIGSRGPTPPGFDLAVAERRAEFKRLALSWSAAYPMSAGAKEAVALSLERLGDPSAIDTIRLARSLAADSTHQLQLAAAEVLMLVRFGIRDRIDLIRRAQVLGDSALSSATPASPEEAEALIPVAVLLGKCRRADQLIGEAGRPGDAVFSIGLYVEAQRVLLRQTTGCMAHANPKTPRDLAMAIDRESASRVRDRPLLDWQLLLRPVLQSAVRDLAMVERVAASTGFPQANAALRAMRGDSRGARAQLATAESAWSRPPTPDVAFQTALGWLSIRDTSLAIRALDVMTEALDTYEPAFFFQDAGTTSAFVMGLVLRADLAGATSDAHVRRRWAGVITTLWSNADDELQPAVKRLSRYANAH